MPNWKKLVVSGSNANLNSLNLSSVVNAGEDTDKFLVLDSSGNIDFRTGANVLSDIGAIGSGNTVTDAGGAADQVGVWSSASAMSGSNNLSFDTSNNRLGIGISSPVAKLHVYQNDNQNDTEAGVTIEQDGTGDAALSFLLTATKRWRLGIDNSDSDKFKISDSTNLASSNRFTIDTSGNVGIGTTSPTQLLHLNSSTSNPTGIGLQNSQRYYSVRSNNYSLVFTDETVGIERMRISSDGNVGIGTTTPNVKLDVSGNVNVTGSLSLTGSLDFISGSTIEYDSNDITTWHLSIDKFFVGTQDTAPEALFFKPDGTKMYILGRSGDDIDEYALSTPWDVTSATYTDQLSGLNSSPSSEANPYGMFISPDGLELYIVGDDQDQVIQWTMSVAWDISTATYTREQGLTDSGGVYSNPNGIHFKPDGTMFWVIGATEDTIQEYTLSTAWNVSTLSLGDSFSLQNFFTHNKLQPTDEHNTADIGSTEDLFFSKDGYKVWVVDNGFDTILQLNLSTAWDITTATYHSKGARTTAYQSSVDGLYVNEAAGKAFTVSTSGDYVRTYNIGGVTLKNNNDSSVGVKNGLNVKGDSTFNGLASFQDIYVSSGFYYGSLNSYSTTSLTHGNGGTVNIIDGTTSTTDSKVDVQTNIFWGTANISQSLQNNLEHNFNLQRPRNGATTRVNIGLVRDNEGLETPHAGVVKIKSLAQTFDHSGSLNVGRTLQVNGKGDLELFDLGGTTVFLDNFTESSTTALESHTPDTGAGWTKVFDDGDTNTWNVIGGTGVASLNASDSDDGTMYLADTTPSSVNYEVRVDFQRRDSSDDTFSIIIKYKDANNYYALQWSTSYSTYCRLIRVEGGSIVNIQNNFGNGVFNQTTDNLASGLKLRYIDDKLMVWDIDPTGYAAFRGSYQVTTDFDDGDGGTYHKVGMALGDLFGGTLDATSTWKIDKFEVKNLSATSTYAAATTHYIENGKLGIGTTSPTYKLDIESSDEIVASFVSTDNKAAIAISDNDTVGYISAENSRISIGPQVGLHANNLNILTSNSNVGIGTSSPAEKLTVAGNISASGDFIGVTGSFDYVKTGNIAASGNISGSDLYIDEYIYHTGDTDTKIGFNTANNIELVAGGNVQISADASRSYLRYQGAAKLYTDSTGVLVLGNINSDSNGAIIFDNTNNNNAWYIRNGGSNAATLQFGLGSSPGSNIQHTFNGDGNIEFGGDVSVAGTITAEQFNTTIVSSSVIFQSGSTQFGDTLDDTHNFTGSLLLSGSATFDIGGRDIVFTNLSGHPKIDAEGTLFLDATGQIQLQTDIIPDSDSSHKIGQSNRFFNSLYVDQTFIGNHTSHIHTITGSANLSGSLNLSDNTKAKFGTGNDLQIYHDGSNSYIQSSGTGDIIIEQRNDDKDIVLNSDDGSGGVTEYFRLDGSFADGNYTYTTRPDGGVITLGDSRDLRLWHDPSTNNSYIRNYTNDLIIETVAAGQDIIFNSGSSEYFRLDGSARAITVSSAMGMYFNDGVAARFGTGGDLMLYHDAANSYIQNSQVGDLIIENQVNDKDIIFKSDNGSGGTTTYLTLDGSQGFTTAQKTIRFDDGAAAQFGADADLRINHNGTDSFITNHVGDLKIIQYTDDGDILFQSDDGSGGATEYFRVDGGTEQNIFSKDILVTNALLSNQQNTDVDTGTETIATIAHASYDAAFFDFVIKSGTNLRAGTVFATHDGTNVEFTETSTNDLGDTSDVTLSVDISGADLRLRATTTSDNWTVKSLVRGL